VVPCYECGTARESNRRGRCADCAAGAQRAYQRSYYTAWKAQNLDHWREYQKAYYQANRKEKIAYATARNQQNRAVSNEVIRRWKRANPLKVAEYEGRRRARTRQSRYEPIEPMRVFDRDGWVCHLCKEPVLRDDASLDHVLPLARGGSHTYDNVATAHVHCNIVRGSKLLNNPGQAPYDHPANT
jgi:5-methylcytosine-specific restriction endonuclease McrA